MRNIQNKYNKRINKNKSKLPLILGVIITIIVVALPILLNYQHLDIPQKIIYYLSRPVAYLQEKIYVYNRADIIYSDYQQMKNNYDNYERIKVENDNLKKEIKILSDNLNLNKSLNNYQTISATVIDRNRNYWYNSLIIDKGRKDKIKEKMSVITSNGLIGIIETVYNNTSIVKMITDVEKYYLSVYIESINNNCQGLISEYDYEKQSIVVKDVSNYCKIYENSRVITTGLGNNYPSGILIGYVEKIESDNFDTSKKVYIRSSQDLNDIRYVMVVGIK